MRGLVVVSAVYKNVAALMLIHLGGFYDGNILEPKTARRS